MSDGKIIALFFGVVLTTAAIVGAAQREIDRPEVPPLNTVVHMVTPNHNMQILSATTFEWPTPIPTPTNTPEPTPEPTATPVPPTPVPVRVAPVQPAPPRASGYSWANDPTCLNRADRYDWKTYALRAGFPEHVVHGEMENVIARESGGDLCAVNRSSGATCWIQQHPGGPQFLDPETCMAQGYSKWLDGGESFHRHWYRWWP